MSDANKVVKEAAVQWFQPNWRRAEGFGGFVINQLREAGYKIVLINPCKCGCDQPAEKHLCPCGCGHTYDEAVANVMRGPMYLNREQAEANIDEHPDVPCKWKEDK